MSEAIFVLSLCSIPLLMARTAFSGELIIEQVQGNCTEIKMKKWVAVVLVLQIIGIGHGLIL